MFRGAAELRRPVRRLLHAVLRAGQVTLEHLPSDAVAREEGGVVQARVAQHPGDAEQHRRVGVRPHRNPLDRGAGVEIVAHRTDIDEAAAGGAHRVQAAADAVLADAAVGNRSEEHTSELQSLMRSSYAVLCLKKKKNKQEKTKAKRRAST